MGEKCAGCKYDDIKVDCDDWMERIPCCFCSRSGSEITCPICLSHGMTIKDHFEAEGHKGEGA